jgi:small subunit ribosomal protein S10e
VLPMNSADPPQTPSIIYKMFIRRKERVATYAYLFKEGVCVVKKDYALPEHPDIAGVRNIEVMALLKSLRSRGFVKETYNWCYYYYYLTNEGIEHLRAFLNLPDEVVPETMNKAAARPAREGEEQRGGNDYGDKRGGDRGDRGGYRRD